MASQVSAQWHETRSLTGSNRAVNRRTGQHIMSASECSGTRLAISLSLVGVTPADERLTHRDAFDSSNRHQ